MMEFEEDHDGEEEEEEEEEEDEEMAITPTFKASTNDGKKPGPIGACRYRECLKNHAIGIGGHAVDGCGEFMPAGTEGTLDALKCAACNCHRNFHRKEIVLDSSGTSPHHHHHHQNHHLALYTPRPQFHPHPHPHPQHPQVYQFYPYNRTSAANPTPTSTTAAAFLQPRPLALPSPSTGGTQNQTQTQEQQEDLMVMMGGGTTSSRKKRFRTKFTQEQKEKMLQLAEQLGWRIQKQDEGLVQNFCNETGVRRHVLKVWMHNNKHTLGKKP